MSAGKSIFSHNFPKAEDPATRHLWRGLCITSRVLWSAHQYSLSHGQTPGGGTTEALCPDISVLLAPDENILATLCLLEQEKQRDALFSVTCLGHLENWLRSHLLHCRPERLFLKVRTVSFIIFDLFPTLKI